MDPGLFILEPAAQADLAAIVRTERSCFDRDGFSRRQLRYLMTKAKGAFYVIRQEGEAVAYLALLSHARRRNLRIYSLAVRPDLQGFGLGSRLVSRAIAYAREAGADRLTLEVRTDNRSALALYAKWGFAPSDVYERYYADGCAAFYMERPVDQGEGARLDKATCFNKFAGKL